MANILDSAYYIDDVKPSQTKKRTISDTTPSEDEHNALHVGKPQGPQ